MMRYWASLRRVTFAALAIITPSACVQDVSAPGTILVRPTHVPVARPPEYDERSARNLVSPPPGAIESRLLPLPGGLTASPAHDARQSKPVTVGSLAASG